MIVSRTEAVRADINDDIIDDIMRLQNRDSCKIKE